MSETIKGAKRRTSSAATRQEQARVEYARETDSMKLLGEIITWHAGEATHVHGTVIAALKSVGLDEKVARELLPRHAFSRACKRLSEERIIDQLRDGTDTIDFQFTKRHLASTSGTDEWRYDKEAVVTLNKQTGKVSCPDAGLQTMAQAELDRCIEARTPGDVTRIIQKLFEREADLFSIREQGGAYFVPAEHDAFNNRIEAFLNTLGGRVSRFPVPAGTKQGDASVETVMATGLHGVIEEHAKAVETFGEDTRQDTLERHAQRIQQTRVKLQAYAHYLGEKRDELVQALEEANKKLAARVNEITKLREADFTVDCDHCQAPNAVSEGQKGARCVKCGQEFSIEW